jgi:hypothetical protein
MRNVISIFSRYIGRLILKSFHLSYNGRNVMLSRWMGRFLHFFTKKRKQAVLGSQGQKIYDVLELTFDKRGNVKKKWKNPRYE